MVAIKGRKSSNKNPPILSHEFVIQNHADIVSCVAMVFVIGLMVQVTSPWANTFIAIHHNASSLISIDDTMPPQPTKYTTGWKDACAVFFYFLITIVLHAVIQEYFFDKISKRLRLSKSKLSKFNESSQLVVFYGISVIWGIDILIRENFIPDVTSLWREYPSPMSLSLKLFFIAQLAYWLHAFPELYFQRVKKEEIFSRIKDYTLALLFTVAVYIMNFQQVALLLLVLNHAGEGLLHVAKLIHFVDQKEKSSKAAFSIANLVFIAVRILTVVVSGLVFGYGLAKHESVLSPLEGKFNFIPLRFALLGAIVLFQLYLGVSLLRYQRKRAQEIEQPAPTKAKVVKQKPKKKEASKKSGGSEDDADSDQGAKKNLRLRSAAAKAK